MDTKPGTVARRHQGSSSGVGALAEDLGKATATSQVNGHGEQFMGDDQAIP